MRQACTVKVVFAGLEDLRLGLQPSERVGEDDTVALDLKGVAIIGLGDWSIREAFEVEVVVESVHYADLACLLRIVSLQASMISTMKYSKSSFILVCLCAGVVLAAISSRAEARIGERKDSIERRLFSSGGIVYRDDIVEQARRRGMPYLKYLELLPESSEIRIYYKTANGRRPASKELDAKRILAGWDVHVLYVDGKSVIEVYKRSQAMTDYEYNQLLALQADGSYWKKKEKAPKSADQQKSGEDISAFGYEMQTANGTVGARKIGNGLLFFDRELDQLLAEMSDSDQMEKAPISVQGF